MDIATGQGGAMSPHVPPTQKTCSGTTALCVNASAAPPEGAPIFIDFPPPPRGQAYGTYMPPAEKPKLTFTDAIFACVLVVIGFLFWEWQIQRMPFGSPVGLGATLFFLIMLGISCVFLYKKGATFSKKSFIAFAVVVLGALSFVLYGARGINALLAFFECVAALLWVAMVCKATIKSHLSGFLALDAVRQMFSIPFKNFFRLFAALGALFRVKRAPGSMRLTVYVVIGLLASIPLLAIVIMLLNGADDGFRAFTEHFDQFFANFDLGELSGYFLSFVLGIPVACYLFGLLYGSYREARTFNEERLNERAERNDASLASLHKLPRAAVYAPLVCFVVLYLVFFAAMGSYLFSAWQGKLPESYTYAQYARQGFFELCGVAVVNLVLLVAVYLFAHRGAREYPRMLRILTGALSACTCLLILAALSKMFLYIQAYGLTPLRLYTSWFMILLMVLFVTLLVWHVRSFNAARPIIVSIAVFMLALGLCNTNGLIAQYNVDRYLAGQTVVRIDVSMLENMGDAAMPALVELREKSIDHEVCDHAQLIIEQYVARLHPEYDGEFGLAHNRVVGLVATADTHSHDTWFTWNLVSQQARDAATAYSSTYLE